MKITVYAICKNEEKFVARWVESMREADEIVVLDTGSNDDTVRLLENYGVRVKVKQYENFRFDKARNDALREVSNDTDVCVCTDLDEVFEKGWRKEIERVFSKGVHKILYRYVWGFDEKGREQTVFYADKIHSLHGWKWKYPVHEVLSRTPSFAPTVTKMSKIKLYHYPDISKDRKSYLPLLIEQLEEYPQDARSYHYLGREYMLCKNYPLAQKYLLEYLKMKNATWDEERSATMRYLAYCSVFLNDGKQHEWFMRAIAQTPTLKEPYFDYACYLFSIKEYTGCLFFLLRTLSLSSCSLAFCMNGDAYGPLVYDMLSICYYHLGDKQNAKLYALKALEYGEDERIRNNLQFFE